MPAFTKFKSSHSYSTAERRGRGEGSETMSTGKINCENGKKQNKTHIVHDFEKLSFSVWLHCTLALCPGVPALLLQTAKEQKVLTKAG